MEPSETATGLSRRRMLKSIGAGAAVAWTAPALVSVGRASAQTASPACPGDDWRCGDPQQLCGSSGFFGACLCDVSVEGGTFCWENFFCSGSQMCLSSSQCPPGWACVSSCCDTDIGFSCAPPCGANVSSTSRSGPNAAGS